MRRILFIACSRKAAIYLMVAVVIFITLGMLGGKIVINVLVSSERDAVCGKTVFIDPGHGGPDPGAVGRYGIIEKDIVLDISLELERILNRMSVYTKLSRIIDRDLADESSVKNKQRKIYDLRARIAQVNESKADLMVSIHANSFPDSVWSGAQTFYNTDSLEGKILAECIQEQLVKTLGPNTRKAKTGDYYILRNANIPAVLVEVGFLSNPREERLLAELNYRKKVAAAVYRGITQYLLCIYEEKEIPVNTSQKLADNNANIGNRDIPGIGNRNNIVSVSEGKEAIFYFGGATNFQDCLIPEFKRISMDDEASKIEKIAESVLRELLSGPGSESILKSVIPKGTVLQSFKIQNGIAYADFSKELIERHWGGSRSEEFTVYSIVNTLTEFKQIKKVQISVNGNSDISIAGHITLDRPLERNISIVEFPK